MHCCYCIIQYSAIALSPNLIQSSAIHLALYEKRILSIWTIGHTYTRAERVAGWRKALGYQFSFSTGISISRHHSSFARHTSLPGHIDLSWLDETHQMLKWVSEGEKAFLSLLSLLIPGAIKNVLALYGILEKLQMVRTQKAVHECHYLNLIQAIFSVSLRLSHLQKNTESGWSKIRTDGNSYGLAGASWRGGNPHMRFD